MADEKTRRILAVAGPTAVGKSALALSLAARLDGEIISCDSMQIYRGMDIGTAKPTAAERSAVPHHMIDVADPGENYSSMDYAAEASSCLDEVLSRGKTPIFCGGTGLYLESVLYAGGQASASPSSDSRLRRDLSARSAEENYAELRAVDPESASSIHPNNRPRVIRALEIYRLSGKPKSVWDRENRREALLFGAELYVLVTSDREALYRAIDLRVDRMMEEGLLEEVARLSLSPETTAGQAIGYKELSAYLAGTCSLTEAVERIKRASRRYAKRQLTWWARNRQAVKIDVAKNTPEAILEAIVRSEPERLIS